jgi:hypothetical protein
VSTALRASATNIHSCPIPRQGGTTSCCLLTQRGVTASTRDSRALACIGGAQREVGMRHACARHGTVVLGF